jgi:hypothetical protein
MKELEGLLTKRETTAATDFNSLKSRVRCYAHIINICASHVISSMTSVSQPYLASLRVPVDLNRNFCDDSEDEFDDDDDPDFNYELDELELDYCYDDCGNPNLREWFAGIKRDPLRRARRLIRLLRSSDQRREGFRQFIQYGNRRKWFFEKNQSGKRCPVQVPELQLLRDVKTRWDSVYTMLERLRTLRPVCSRLGISETDTNLKFDVGDRSVSCYRIGRLCWVETVGTGLGHP